MNTWITGKKVSKTSSPKNEDCLSMKDITD